MLLQFAQHRYHMRRCRASVLSRQSGAHNWHKHVFLVLKVQVTCVLRALGLELRASTSKSGQGEWLVLVYGVLGTGEFSRARRRSNSNMWGVPTNSEVGRFRRHFCMSPACFYHWNVVWYHIEMDWRRWFLPRCLEKVKMAEVHGQRE